MSGSLLQRRPVLCAVCFLGVGVLNLDVHTCVSEGQCELSVQSPQVTAGAHAKAQPCVPRGEKAPIMARTELPSVPGPGSTVTLGNTPPPIGSRNRDPQQPPEQVSHALCTLWGLNPVTLPDPPSGHLTGQTPLDVRVQ